MAKGYRPVDRDQVFLLPPDMRDWVGRDDPVWLVIATVQRMDTAPVHRLRKTGGVGRRGYDPDMLLTLLIWAWAHGQRSSRQIERLCSRDLTYRVICAGDVPDHSTIAQFRKDASTVMADLFAESLTVCAQLGMGQLGVVALDGVKIASNASQAANRTEKHLVKEREAEVERLRRELKGIGAQSDAEHAANDDDSDGDRGDGVPPDLIGAPGTERLKRIDEALASAREHNRAARDAMPTQTRAEINRDHLHRRRAGEDAKAQQWVGHTPSIWPAKETTRGRRHRRRGCGRHNYGWPKSVLINKPRSIAGSTNRTDAGRRALSMTSFQFERRARLLSGPKSSMRTCGPAAALRTKPSLRRWGPGKPTPARPTGPVPTRAAT